jgi:SAM-dependent methyltransferase
MAKLVITHHIDNNEPEFTEEVEVRVWGCAAKKGQEVVIGSGSNFIGDTNFFLEILYSVNGLNAFYTRTILSTQNAMKGEPLRKRVDDFTTGESDSFGFGDMLPETYITFERKKFTYQSSPNGEERTVIDYELVISADVGAVFASASPGERSIDIKIKEMAMEDGLNFIRDFSIELAEARHGKHPDPAKFPPGSSDWPFIRQLNQKAYDIISAEYQEDYFNTPLLAKMINDWLNMMPAAGHILDAGCGHGDPVITYLIERGFHVTGSDLSSAMLKRAQERFPGLPFYHRATTQVSEQEVYDGICSLNSLLYLDPVDLSNSLYRLHQALKPGGLLFLFAYDMHPSYRGAPYNAFMKQWVWDWTYGLSEVKQLLEEHGYFKVLRARNVTTQEEKKTRVGRWRMREQEQYDTYAIKYKENGVVPPPPPDLTTPPKTLGYCYAIIAQKA